MTLRRSPLIIIGMHRSGTSLVTRLLEMLGLFVGAKKDGNHEASFFHRINEWLIGQCGGSWEHPQPIQYLLENEAIRKRTTDYIIRYLLRSPRTISFLGATKYLRYRTLSNLDVAWGWKSPLNTYTLPLWLDIFPDAKVIHIYRHGVDVANSLRTRARRQTQRTPRQEIYYRLKFLHWVRPKAGGFMGGMRCASLEGGLSLWDDYLREARRHLSALQGRALEARYEDLLAQPYRVLHELASFCGLPVSETAIAQVAEQVKMERAYAYLGNPELQAFANRVAERLRALSY